MGIQALPTLPSNLPLDWVVLVALAIIFAVDTYRAGAKRPAMLILALPAAWLLYSLLSHAAIITASLALLSSQFDQALLFLGILIVMLVVTARLGIASGAEASAPIQSTLVGIIVVVVLVCVWLQVPALNSIWHFGPQVQAIFAEQYRFWWLIGSYLVLAILRG